MTFGLDGVTMTYKTNPGLCVSLLCLLTGCLTVSPVHMENVTLWRDSLDTIESFRLQGNLGEEPISTAQGHSINVNQ